MKNKIYKLIFLLSLLPVVTSSCVSAYTDRIYLAVDPTADKAEKTIREEVESDLLLLFGMLPLSKKGTPDIKTVLADIQRKHGCESLRNVDIEYYNLSYIVVSKPKMVVTADCIGERSILDKLEDVLQ